MVNEFVKLYSIFLEHILEKMPTDKEWVLTFSFIPDLHLVSFGLRLWVEERKQWADVSRSMEMVDIKCSTFSEKVFADMADSMCEQIFWGINKEN